MNPPMNPIEELATAVDGLAGVDFARDPSARARLGALLPSLEAVGAAIGEAELAQLYARALSDWLEAGAEGAPDYAFLPEVFDPSSSALVFFAGFTRATNGLHSGKPNLELLVARPDLPEACGDYAGKHGVDLTTCTPARLVSASSGYRAGSCLTFFTEDVVGCPAQRQTFGIFLLEKFRGMFERRTLPIASRALGRDVRLDLPDADWYEARCCWAVAHERFHQVGPLPLRDAIAEKTTPEAAAIEEFRADAAVCLDALEGDLPHAYTVLSMVTLDRVFRYPAAADAGRNFDAAAGLLLFRALHDADVFADGLRERRAAFERSRTGLRQELQHINWIERAPDRLTRDARRLEYLTNRLGQPAENNLFAFPADYPGGG